MAKSSIYRPHLWATQPPDCGDMSFHGEWTEKYWKNIPGPFYSTTSNMMSLLALGNETNHLLYDDSCEFVWRQPVTQNEYLACLRAMDCDDVSSYAVDGNQHWTPELVRMWCKRRPELLTWAEAHLRRPKDNGAAFKRGNKDATDRNLFREYIRFLKEDAGEYLRSYIFFLLEGRSAQAGDVLPSL